MKIKTKPKNKILFKELLPGTVFRFIHRVDDTICLVIRPIFKDGLHANYVDLRTGIPYVTQQDTEVELIDGVFVEGIKE